MSTTAMTFAFVAVGAALVAAPGGLVWLSISVPAVSVANEGLLSLLADVVTIPAAMLSWLFASVGSILAVVALLRRRRDRRAVRALLAGGPGAVLGSVVIVLVALQLGTSTGILPSAADDRREIDAEAVALHLVMPSAGTTLVARCAEREGLLKEQRIIRVVEQWSPSRLAQIRTNLHDYPVDFSAGPTSPADQQPIYFSGTDNRGNHIVVSIGRLPAGSTVNLGCRRITLKEEALSTEIILSD